MGWTWIGLNDLKVLNTYVWSDGSPNNYQKWSLNEPSSETERCGHYWNTQTFSSSGWNDLPCNQKRRFVCKVE